MERWVGGSAIGRSGSAARRGGGETGRRLGGGRVGDWEKRVGRSASGRRNGSAARRGAGRRLGETRRRIGERRKKRVGRSARKGRDESAYGQIEVFKSAKNFVEDLEASYY